MLSIASIATSGRRPNQLQRTVDSLMGQVDQLYLYDNSRLLNITDNAKFYGLRLISEPCYFFTCDDDIIYPANYVEKTKEHLKDHPVVTYHGRILNINRSRYYGGHKEYSFQSQQEGRVIDVAGTGVLAFNTSTINPVEILTDKRHFVTDLLFSLLCAQKSIPIYLAPHPAGWIKQQEVFDGIMRSQKKTDQSLQVNLCNEIYQIRHGVI